MRLTIVTSNPGKAAEFGEALGKLGIETVHRKIEYDEVQSDSLEEVVRKGMEELRSKGISDFVIDDTGLFIDALKGFPGVWSAYVQKTIGNPGILKLMEDSPDRGAEFRTCIGCDMGGETVMVTGACRGEITERPRGTDGFGYDPIFTADGKRTFAEIDLSEKNVTSHRGNAIRRLVEEIEKRRLL